MFYYDFTAGRQRIKRRYVWAFWSFPVGAIAGIVLALSLFT